MHFPHIPNKFSERQSKDSSVNDHPLEVTYNANVLETVFVE